MYLYKTYWQSVNIILYLQEIIHILYEYMENVMEDWVTKFIIKVDQLPGGFRKQLKLFSIAFFYYSDQEMFYVFNEKNVKRSDTLLKAVSHEKVRP